MTRTKEKQMAEFVLLYATAPDAKLAESIAAELVEARAAACVNIIPGMRSVYRWRGKIESADEVVLIVKTTMAAAERARALILERHPYENPAVLGLPLDADCSSAAFLDWIAEETLQTRLS
jgi:periplasmic divalent cation tolerance protein